MAYEDIPTENAPALPVTADEWAFSFSLDNATVDDLDLFSAENSTSNKQMLDFLDRVVTKVTKRGDPVIAHIKVKETYEENGETKERDRTEDRPWGVRGMGIPYLCLKRLMEGVGETMKEANNPKS